MRYRVESTKTFDKQFKKLDKYTQLLIQRWIMKHLHGCDDPRSIGKALKGKSSGQWRYRIGDYRLICFIEDKKLVILALSIGHRREIYSK